MEIVLNPPREYVIGNIVGGVLTSVLACAATSVGIWFISIAALG